MPNSTPTAADSASAMAPEQIDRAARALAAVMDYPWKEMPEQGRNRMRNDAIAVIGSALSPAHPEPPAEAKSLNAHVADLLRQFLQPGQKVIWREAFRWHDDNGVLSNHYDGMELESLAADFGYDWKYDFNFKHAAIVGPQGPTP